MIVLIANSFLAFACTVMYDLHENFAKVRAESDLLFRQTTVVVFNLMYAPTHILTERINDNGDDTSFSISAEPSSD